MMMACPDLVALATTHLPYAKFDAITNPQLPDMGVAYCSYRFTRQICHTTTGRILGDRFKPLMRENGYLGREEIRHYQSHLATTRT